MKIWIAIIILYFCCTQSFSQPVPPTGYRNSIVTISQPQTVFTLSATPNVQELADRFVDAGVGKLDPFEVVSKVAERGDNAVPGITELIKSETIRGTVPPRSPYDTSTTPIEPPKPNKIYAAMALEAIGTDLALKTLFEVAGTTTDPELRAFALHSLASSAYQRSLEKAWTPNKELLHLLFRSADDTTQSVYFQRKIGDVAREGLRNWAELDLGSLEPPPADSSLGVERRSLNVDREQWWQQNSAKFVWSKKDGRFSISK